MPTFDVTEETVTPLGVESASAATYTRTNFGYDHAIAGLPFLSAASDQYPYQRGLAEQRRQQVDTSTEPGEQSLEGWWLRSQTDLSGGNGVKFLEPVNDEFTMRRCTSSVGVNTWKQGEWFLLNDVTASTTMGSGACGVAVVESGGTDYVFSHDGTTVYRNGTSVSGWSGTVTSITSAGSRLLACHSTGIDVLASPYTTPAALHTGAAATPRAWWVKQRIIASEAHELHEFTLSAGTFSSPLYAHPNPDWRWTAATETATSILVAGYAGATSAIYQFSLDSNGALPTLTAAVTAAELPTGERVTGLFSYLGMVVIGTSEGVRVAQLDGNGSLVYGPLSYESSHSIQYFTGRDRFVYFPINDSPQLFDSTDPASPGLVCLDLSSDDGQGRYAWANDLRTYTAGTVYGVDTRTDGRLIFVASHSSVGKVWTEDTSNLVAAGGEVTTGLVRFNTLEPKMFRNVRLRGSIPAGTVNLYSYDGTNRISLSSFASGSGLGELLNLDDESPIESMGLTFRLKRGSALSAPTVSGWQLRALPAVERQQILVVPLLCFDTEQDRNGVRRGGEGEALSRLTALLDAVAGGQVVTYQDLNTGERFAVQVEDVQFTQMSPPVAGEGFGGIIQLRARTV